MGISSALIESVFLYSGEHEYQHLLKEHPPEHLEHTKPPEHQEQTLLSIDAQDRRIGCTPCRPNAPDGLGTYHTHQTTL